MLINPQARLQFLHSTMILDLAYAKYNTSHQNLMSARLSFQEHQTVKMSFPYFGVGYVLIMSVVLLKIQVFCDVKLFHLVCTVLGVLAPEDEGTMFFKNFMNFTCSGTSQRI